MVKGILVISDDLVEPPSEVLPFRTVTMLCHDKLHLECLLHTTQEMKDLYFRFMKPRGMLDYISYILNEYEYEEGIRLDTLGIYPNTIVTKYIRLENQIYLFNEVKKIGNK